MLTTLTYTKPIRVEYQIPGTMYEEAEGNITSVFIHSRSCDLQPQTATVVYHLLVRSVVAVGGGLVKIGLLPAEAEAAVV